MQFSIYKSRVSNRIKKVEDIILPSSKFEYMFTLSSHDENITLEEIDEYLLKSDISLKENDFIVADSICFIKRKSLISKKYFFEMLGIFEWFFYQKYEDSDLINVYCPKCKKLHILGQCSFGTNKTYNLYTNKDIIHIGKFGYIKKINNNINILKNYKAVWV